MTTKTLLRICVITPLLLMGCTNVKTVQTPKQICPEMSQLPPNLSVLQEPIYTEKLKKVWLSPQNVTK